MGWVLLPLNSMAKLQGLKWDQYWSHSLSSSPTDEAWVGFSVIHLAVLH